MKFHRVVLGSIIALALLLSAAPASAETPPPYVLAINGLPRVSQVLQGVISGGYVRQPGDVVSFTWLVADRPVGSGWSFTPAPAHVDQMVSLAVRIERAGSVHFEGRVTASRPVVPGLLSGYVRIDGEPFVGFTVGVRSQVEPSTATFTYQWTLDGTPIPGAVSKSLALTPAMVGRNVGLVVTAAAPGYTTAAFSDSEVISDRVSLGWLSVRSPAYAGEIIGAAPSMYRPVDTVFSYQWLLDGVVLPGLTKDCLFLRPEWAGRKVEVRVTGTYPGLKPMLPASVAVRVTSMRLQQAPSLGIWQQPASFEAAVTLWPDRTTVSGYQWYRADTEDGPEVLIPGATSAKLPLGSSDQFKFFRVKATVTPPDGQAIRMQSNLRPYWVDPYTTPGTHSYNGRLWRTSCEPYSVTTRCRTDIWATTVTSVGGRYVQRNGWSFNNLTYLASPYRYWRTNPLANPGTWTDKAGRRWKTECYATTQPRNCRTFVWSTYIASQETAGGWTYFPIQGWVFNNQVITT